LLIAKKLVPSQHTSCHGYELFPVKLASDQFVPSSEYTAVLPDPPPPELDTATILDPFDVAAIQLDINGNDVLDHVAPPFFDIYACVELTCKATKYPVPFPLLKKPNRIGPPNGADRHAPDNTDKTNMIMIFFME
jgi:hypothetical protein